MTFRIAVILDSAIPYLLFERLLVRTTLATLAVLALTSFAFGEAIDVTNSSFEEPAMDPGGWTNDLPENGWTQLPEAGSAFIEHIVDFSSDGLQHLGMAQGAEVFQDLGVGLTPNTTYTLTVNAGNRNANFTPEGQASTFGLYLGNSATDGGTLLVSGTFDAFTLAEASFSDDLSVNYATGDTVDAGNLFVSLSSTGEGRAHFDNIRVDAVPEPGAGLLACMAALGIMVIRRRR